MSNISVTFKALGSISTQSIPVSLSMRVRDFRECVQTMLSFDDAKCRIVIEKTGEELEDSQSFEEACVQSGDVLMVIPVETVKPLSSLRATSSNEAAKSGFQQIQSDQKLLSPKTTYKLILTLADSAQKVWEYSVQLEECYENDPQLFYSISGGVERDKFEDFLKNVLKRSVDSKEVNKILQNWCNDIAQGHRTTSLVL
jgi:hypothetical protein